MLAACTATGDDPTGDTDPGTDDGQATDDAPATGGSADDAPADDGANPTDASGSSDGNGSEDDGDTGGDADTGDDAGALACTDQMILDLGLVQGVLSEGSANDTADGDGFVSVVDATAGGIMDAPENPWLYLRFTPDGLRKVEVDDLQALESTEWDIAAKRFGLRLNGGVSGPSTVAAAPIEGAAYEDLDEVPADAAFEIEAFYDEGCTLVDDGSGQGAPDYALTPWWFYPGCVGTTLVPFVLELADGSHVKLVVEAYYAEGQAECNEGGAMGTTAAMYTWRWAYLP